MSLIPFKVGVLPENIKIDTLDDLIYVGMNYTGCVFDSGKLWKIVPQLIELKKIVGMSELKECIVNVVKNALKQTDTDQLMHTVLYGPPGVGKTTVAKILAKIYCNLGFLSTSKVVIADRSSFIGKYVGHSEAQTNELLKSALGGVLFIDEAYSLGAGERSDVFSKAVIDILNKFLTEHKNEFICIIAGYEEEIKSSFFSVNRGMESRFPVVFHIPEYTPEELHAIFVQKVSAAGLGMKGDNIDFFKKNIKSFPYFGRDIEALIGKVKIAFTNRTFWDTTLDKQIISQDVETGMEMYLKHKKNKRHIDEVLTYFL